MHHLVDDSDESYLVVHDCTNHSNWYIVDPVSIKSADINSMSFQISENAVI